MDKFEEEVKQLLPADKLARLFHDTYERLAPMFNYTTRTDTREFDSLSTNGRFMIAVIEGAILPAIAAALRAEHKRTMERYAATALTANELYALADFLLLHGDLNNNVCLTALLLRNKANIRVEMERELKDDETPPQ